MEFREHIRTMLKDEMDMLQEPGAGYEDVDKVEMWEIVERHILSDLGEAVNEEILQLQNFLNEGEE